MNTPIKQTSKWQLIAISIKAYENGAIYTDTTKLLEFKDLTKEYLTVIYKRDYNGMVLKTSTDDGAKANKAFSGRHDTLSTSHACILTTSNDNDSIKQVQGRSSYRMIISDATTGAKLLLVKPKGIYL